MRCLYWLRNDLRVQDNKALNDFCRLSTNGAVVWFPTASLQRAGHFRRSFVLGSLDHHLQNLKKLGLEFYMFSESASQCLPSLISENQIDTVFFSDEVGTEEKTEESLLARISDVRLKSYFQSTLLDPASLPFSISELPPVFSNFRRLVEKKLIIPAPDAEPTIFPKPLELKHQLKRFDLNSDRNSWIFHDHIKPGEEAALDRLQDYIWSKDRLRVYKDTRNGMMNWDDSSKLSPWLAIGALSPRTVYQNITDYESQRIKNDSTYWLFFELLWRDYFYFNALKQGSSLYTKINSVVSNLFQTWADAETGDDFIDANMGELNQTGWMSNRGRQIVASYLAKSLNVNWILGADYFEKMLIDYDAANNWGNWAYQAGVGQDPRDRTFNTKRQADMYDPDGAYRRKWLKN